ncbi:MAG: hypothetical protein GEU97_11480 [Actinophytocola sp.]|nr:hypothetical protein [Actinophytocola sp.]
MESSTGGRCRDAAKPSSRAPRLCCCCGGCCWGGCCWGGCGAGGCSCCCGGIAGHDGELGGGTVRW